jgi:hypothetical protein
MKTIRTYRPILSVEFNPESAESANTTVEEMQKSLENVGYRLMVLGRLRTGSFRFDRKEPFQPAIHCADNLCNILYLPADTYPIAMRTGNSAFVHA